MKKETNVAIIGVGLIGGSLGYAIQSLGIAHTVIGVDNNKEHIKQALQLGIINKACSLKKAIQIANIFIVATPINITNILLPQILSLISPQQIVMDVGSTKEHICKTIAHHPQRKRFVATHPMWGTEHSGPQAAVKNAFKNKATLICEQSKSDRDALQWVKKLYQQLEMRLIYLSAHQHDIHVAYISHISHITSFALANTVLEKEKEEKQIFNLASSGFESTVRLAKSNPYMWAPILLENKKNILEVLNEHIKQLQAFKISLEENNKKKLMNMMHHANEIKRILK